MRRLSRRARAITCALSVMTCAAAPLAVSAQTPPPPTPPIAPITPSSEELDRSRQAPTPDRARPDVFAPEGAGPCPLRDSTLTFTLRTVEFRGSTVLTAADFAPAYAGQVGREAPVSTICDIRDRAYDILFARGFYARVEIPEQRIADGALVLEVVEARIASVRVRGDAGPAQSKVEDYIERLRGMAPFNLNEVQRYLLLATDVPGVRLGFAVRPSAQGRGAVDLEVTILERDPVDVIVNVQNLGAKSLGRWGGLVKADFNSFTRFGEQTSLVVYSTLESDEQRLVQLIEEIRIGSDGLIARGSLAYAKSKPGDIFEPLNLEGDSFVGQLAASYPLIRKRRHSLYVSGGLDWVDQVTEFDSGDPLTEDHLRVLFAKVDDERVFDFSPALRLELLSGAEVRKGLSALDASEDGESVLSRNEGVPDAWVVRGYLRAKQTFGRWVTGFVTAEAQYAEDPLLAYEEQAVGNLTIGRGYDPTSVSGDIGAAASFEVLAGPFQPASWAEFYAVGFYDVAYVDNHDEGAEARTVDSAGFGVRMNLGRYLAALSDRFANLDQSLSLNVLFVRPFDPPIDASETRPPDRILVNLVAQLY